MNGDTIAAISTAVSESGIGIIRVCGEEAFEITDRIFRKKGKSVNRISQEPTHTIHYGMIYDDDEMIDEVLVTIMKAPRSFTTEDTIEINCHGGVYAMRRVLDTVLKNGARLADAGEFTKRAFLNGRIDLSQAEAVIDVIQAKNEYALKSSVSQLKGSLLEKIKKLRSDLIYEIAFIESALDDPEHISLDGYPQELLNKEEDWIASLDKMIASADNGRIVKEGIKTVIVGRPNAGKSSLLNALVGEERAIVTNIAGTTRDVLTETISIGGITLLMMDTAGIRETNDLIEQIGVDKAREYAKDADLILYIVDSSEKMDESDEAIMHLLHDKKTIIILNKTDLESKTTKEIIENRLKENLLDSGRIISVSAKEQTGIEDLEDMIKEMFYHGNLTFNDQVMITNVRQKRLLQDAFESLCQVKESIKMDMPEDFFSIDLMNAYEALGKITGETAGEDLVNEIFSKFCMGK